MSFGKKEFASLAMSALVTSRVMIADLFCAFFWGVLADSAVWRYGFGDLPPDPDFRWPMELLLLGLGLGTLAWIQYRIWWPKVVSDRVGRGAAARLEIPLLTSHPSYALFDLLWVPLFFAAGISGASALPSSDIGPSAHRELVMGYLLALGAIGLLLLVAATRVGAWVVFRRRVAPQASQGAWIPVAFIIAALGALGVAISIVQAARGG